MTLEEIILKDYPNITTFNWEFRKMTNTESKSCPECSYHVFESRGHYSFIDGGTIIYNKCQCGHSWKDFKYSPVTAEDLGPVVGGKMERMQMI